MKKNEKIIVFICGLCSLVGETSLEFLAQFEIPRSFLAPVSRSVVTFFLGKCSSWKYVNPGFNLKADKVCNCWESQIFPQVEKSKSNILMKICLHFPLLHTCLCTQPASWNHWRNGLNCDQLKIGKEKYLLSSIVASASFVWGDFSGIPVTFWYSGSNGVLLLAGASPLEK